VASISSDSGGSTASARKPLHGEQPFFLDVAGCPLYAVHHPCLGDPPSRAAVLVVPPLGVEQLTGYRSEVLLGRALARRGIATLRFHPRGQGDSGGTSDELTLASFSEDVRAAAAELRRRSGAERVIAVGVRLGALALAAAMRAGESVAALALWEPVSDPGAYFQELLRSVVFADVAQGRAGGASADAMRERIEREGSVDVLGYPLHRALTASAGETLPALLGAWAGPTLLVQIDSRRSLSRPHASLAEALRSRGASTDVREIRAEVSWYFLQNPAWENAELVATTAEWIEAHA
jgi:exosortase A-associated hydrolase 2